MMAMLHTNIDYLSEFSKSDDAIVVGALADGEIVGVATGAPLASHSSSFGALFEGHGINPAHVFYCGESVS